MQLISLQNIAFPDLESLFLLNNLSFPSSLWTKKVFDLYFARTSFFPLGFILKTDAKIVGFIFGKPNLSKDFFYIDFLWVYPEHRGKSLGKLLMEKMLDEIRKIKSVQEVGLHFREANRLENFYKKLGFSRLEVPRQYKNGDIKISMRLKIK